MSVMQMYRKTRQDKINNDNIREIIEVAPMSKNYLKNENI